MKKQISLLLACSVSISALAQQNFQSYFKDGLYQFDDGVKIKKSEILTTSLSSFGFTQDNTMVLQQEGQMDDDGGVSGRYFQYYKGYKVEGTTMNVISKYGIVVMVNGFSIPNLSNVSVANPISESSALSAALQRVNAGKYAWQDNGLEASIKMKTLYKHDTAIGDTLIDSSRTYYPKGQLVIALPYGDTNIHDTSKYKLCWKFPINPLYLDTFTVDTNTVDTVAHYETVVQWRLHNEIIVYINALNDSVTGVDSNTYGWTGHINPTYYHGNQDVDITYNGYLHPTDKFSWHDAGRNIIWSYYDGVTSPSTSPKGTGTDTWSGETGSTAYWALEKTSDYYRYHYGFWGTQPPPAAYAIPQYVSTDFASTVETRTQYSYNSTANTDRYGLGADITTNPSLPMSAAYLDLMAHEYTHAIIRHGVNLSNYGEAGAIMEGLCDFFGTCAAYDVYPSLYTLDWTLGFGCQTSQIRRRFADPILDYPTASSASYGDAYWSSDKYVEAGVMRHQIVLHDWGGSYNGISVAATPPTSHDLFVTMNWWLWSTMNYHDARNQFLAENIYYYHQCSPTWMSNACAWAAVGVGSVPSCKRAIVFGPKVIPVTQSHSNVYVPTPPNTKQHSVVVTQTDNTHNYILSYSWSSQQGWYTSFPGQDRSTLQIDSVTDLTSRIVSCIVTYTDSTTDTLSTYVHFVGDDYETIQQNGNKPGITSITSEQPIDDITIYPNPAKTFFNISLPFQPSRPIEFSLTDIMGKDVPLNNKYLYGRANLVQLPEISSGVYILKIKENGREYVKRISVKQ